MVSPRYYRQQAKLCFELAAVATDRNETERLVSMAQRFARLAEEANEEAYGPSLPPHMIPHGASGNGTDAN